MRVEYHMVTYGRAFLLAMARNETVKTLLERNGISKGLVQRFIAGETVEAAMAVAVTLQQQGILAALDRLGENVEDAAAAEASAMAYVGVLEAANAAGLDRPYLSVKLTAIGLDLSDEIAKTHLWTILAAAQAHQNAFVRVDMEGSAYTERTLQIVCEAHREFSNVGTVLQASLYRTDSDLEDLIADGICIRLVKGAYLEPSQLAYPAKADVDAAYVRQMKRLLSAGIHPAIATHDEQIIHQVKRFLREHKIANDQFEFQMLLGIRRDLQCNLCAEGYPVRAYIPFGQSWYPYFMRRLAERPANILFLLKSLLKP